MWLDIRWPIVAIVLSGALIGVSFLLDLGGTLAREMSLFLGSSALFLLLPASLIWLLVAIVLHVIDRRSSRRTGAR